MSNKSFPIYFALLFLLVIFGVVKAENRLDIITKEWSRARMIEFGVLITAESEIFNTVDSSRGKVIIADDGRYYAEIGEDLYLFDGQCIWEMSFENRQATKQCLKEGEKFENRLIFLKDLGNLYKARALVENEVYFLSKNEGSGASLPDSLRLYLSLEKRQISEIIYYDLNSERNHVYLNDVQIFQEIADSAFKFVPSDSIEIIVLP